MQNNNEEIDIKTLLKDWQDFGKKLIYPEFNEEWNEFLLNNVFIEKPCFKIKDFYSIMHTICILDLNNNFDLAKTNFIKNSRGETLSQSLRCITLFAKNGIEFFKDLKQNNYSQKTAEYLDHIDAMKKIYAANEKARKRTRKQCEADKKQLEVDFEKI